MQPISTSAQTFISKWTNNIEYIRSSTKSTRKIENECKIMNACFGQNSVDRMNTTHSGIILIIIQIHTRFYVYIRFV